MEGKDKRMKDGSTTSKMVHCQWCGQSFRQFDDGKGTPQLYCSKLCRSATHRQRNLESRARRGKMKIAPWQDLYTDTGSGSDKAAQDSLKFVQLNQEELRTPYKGTCNRCACIGNVSMCATHKCMKHERIDKQRGYWTTEQRDSHRRGSNN
jgi:hypothetical protein